MQQYTYDELIIILASLQYLKTIKDDWKINVDNFNAFMRLKGFWFDPALNFINSFGKTVIGSIGKDKRMQERTTLRLLRIDQLLSFIDVALKSKYILGDATRLVSIKNASKIEDLFVFDDFELNLIDKTLDYLSSISSNWKINEDSFAAYMSAQGYIVDGMHTFISDFGKTVIGSERIPLRIARIQQLKEWINTILNGHTNRLLRESIYEDEKLLRDDEYKYDPVLDSFESTQFEALEALEDEIIPDVLHNVLLPYTMKSQQSKEEKFEAARKEGKMLMIGDVEIVESKDEKIKNQDYWFTHHKFKEDHSWDFDQHEAYYKYVLSDNVKGFSKFNWIYNMSLLAYFVNLECVKISEFIVDKLEDFENFNSIQATVIVEKAMTIYDASVSCVDKMINKLKQNGFRLDAKILHGDEHILLKNLVTVKKKLKKDMLQTIIKADIIHPSSVKPDILYAIRTKEYLIASMLLQYYTGSKENAINYLNSDEFKETIMAMERKYDEKYTSSVAQIMQSFVI